MPVVVDASVALAWCLPDEKSADADRVLQHLIDSGETMVAPALWVQETANAIVTAHRRGRLTDAQAQRCIEILAALPVEIDPRPDDPSTLVPAAIRHGLSAYDATYLLLAERTGAALASLDERLGRAARTAGVVLLP